MADLIRLQLDTKHLYTANMLQHIFGNVHKLQNVPSESISNIQTQIKPFQGQTRWR
jgi:Asp-tRNA(Asn)/Glu-tRNA(Gln) amidotransferase C subunit